MPINLPLAQLLPLQQLLFPLIKAFLGVDVAEEFLKPGGDKFSESADVLDECSELLRACAAALADGQLDLGELNVIIDEANDIPAAVAKLKDFSGFGKPDTEG